MPHIAVQMHSGRTKEIKEELTERLVQTMVDVLGVPDEYISVCIQDIPANRWDQEVYPEIMKNQKILYKKPGYEVD